MPAPEIVGQPYAPFQRRGDFRFFEQPFVDPGWTRKPGHQKSFNVRAFGGSGKQEIRASLSPAGPLEFGQNAIFHSTPCVSGRSHSCGANSAPAHFRYFPQPLICHDFRIFASIFLTVLARVLGRNSRIRGARPSQRTSERGTKKARGTTAALAPGGNGTGSAPAGPRVGRDWGVRVGAGRSDSCARSMAWARIGALVDIMHIALCMAVCA